MKVKKVKVDFGYHVSQTTPLDGKHFLIQKVHPEHGMVGSYEQVVNYEDNKGNNDELWCDCMGFRRQTYAKIDHKHVRIVLAFMERTLGMGEGIGVYRLKSDGTPVFVSIRDKEKGNA